MATYTISRCEPVKTFDKKDGSGSGRMQKIVLRDDVGKDYKCTVFSCDEAFVGDIVQATLKGYSEKFREYQVALHSVTPGPRGIPNTAKEPSISVEGQKGGSYARSPEESERIVRQSTLKAVADLWSGKGDPEKLGEYLGLADQMTEWCMTATVTPRISKEERGNLVKRFGSVEEARSAAMGAWNIPFLHLLSKSQYDALMDGSKRTFPLD
jgi:hypothetical protein